MPEARPRKYSPFCAVNTVLLAVPPNTVSDDASPATKSEPLPPPIWALLAIDTTVVEPAPASTESLTPWLKIRFDVPAPAAVRFR